MKKIIFFLAVSALFAKLNTQNIVGKNTYSQYKGLITSLITDKNVTNLADAVTILKENGLIELFFKKPRIINPKFVFFNNNPVFETKLLNHALQTLGYYYYYPVNMEKNATSYSITLEMLSTHFIDPVNFINAMQNNGCNITEMKKENGNYTYTIDCSKAFLNVPSLKADLKAYLKIRGVYWFETNGFSKLQITTSKYDRWHPYIAFYDKNLNIIEIFSDKNTQRKVIIPIPNGCKYIKIKDTFTRQNIKRGIFIKGIQ